MSCLHSGSLGPPAQHAEPAEAPQRLDGGVHPHAQDAHQRLPLAIAGEQHDPGAHRLVGRDQGQLLPAADDPAGAGRCPPRERVEELRLAVALGPGDPDDLTAVQREADRAERLSLQGIDDEHFLGFGRRRTTWREHRLERAADDAFDELRFCRRRGVEGSLVLAVAEHRDPVCDLEHFGQPMADVDHTDAAPLARQDGAVERLRPHRGRARSWARRAAAPWARSRVPWRPRTAGARPS